MALSSTPQMRALAAAVRANVPALLWGPPGVGKSAKLGAYAAGWGRHMETVVGSVREASDYLGLPTEAEDGSTGYLAPSFAVKLNAADSGLLFLDELSTAAPSVQKAMLRLLQERYAGDLPLGEHVAIVAAANPPEQAADGWDLPAPVANRLLHLDWHFDVDEWLTGVVTDFAHQQVHSMDSMLGKGSDSDHARAKGYVTAFLRANPQLLNPTPPEDETEAGRAWPSPRSWTNTMNVLSELDPADDAAALLVVKGCVGEGAAQQFFAWMTVSDLYDPAEVMADPSVVAWSEERPDRLFALTTGIAALALSRNDEKAMKQSRDALVACGQGGRRDVALPAMRQIVSHYAADGRFTRTAAAERVFTEIFARTGMWAHAA